MKNDKIYFAKQETEDLVVDLMSFIEKYTNEVSMSVNDGGLQAIWARNMRLYYQNALTGSLMTSLDFTGEQGELVRMSTMESRSLMRQLISLVCKQKIDFKSIMSVTNYSSFADGQIADALASSIVKEEQLDLTIEKVAENAYLCGAGYYYTTWDENAGRTVMIDPASQTPVYEGKAKVKSISPQCVFGDAFIPFKDWEWCVVAEKQNRWNLMSLHPEMAEPLEKVPSASQSLFTRKIEGTTLSTKMEDSNVWVYTFYHKPTDALPSGRMTMFCNKDTFFHDGVNEYECLPLIECIPEPFADTSFGYPPFCNLAPLQELLDHNVSVIATNQSATGVQTILNPRGSNINIKQINGMNWIDYTPLNTEGGGKPESLQLTKSAPELFESIKFYKQELGQNVGIGGVLRGDLQGVTAASGIATLTANSIESLTSFSKALFSSLERAVTLAVKYYKMFGQEDKIVSIVGENNSSYAKEFKSSSLESFQCLKMTLQNPLMNVLGGRIQIADNLLQKGLIKNVEQYFMVLEGQPVKTLYEVQLAEDSLIEKENSDLRRGIPVHALYFDNHEVHIAQHKCNLSDPEIRRNGQILELNIDHIEEHERLMVMASNSMMGVNQIQSTGTHQAPLDHSTKQVMQGSQAEGNEGMKVAEPAKPAKDILRRGIV